MVSNEKNGYCLVPQQIRDKIERDEIIIPGANVARLGRADRANGKKKGWFEDDALEKRVQPASFDATIGDYAFILDSEHLGVFRPRRGQTVYRALLELPRRLRRKVDMRGGFETKVGHTYAIPIDTRVKLAKGERMFSSPKSSIGRLFPRTRLIADHTPSFDSVEHIDGMDDPFQLWLLFQPTAFNLILHPGLALNQLRFTQGTNVTLSQRELIAEFKKNPLLQDKAEDGTLTPANPIITDDGMRINLDLTGRHTYGIVGLRARRNPEAIDLSRLEYYKPGDWFEPIEKQDGKVRLHTGERYLLPSAGVLSIPSHLSALLVRLGDSGVQGSYHEAGFLDPEFSGDLVSEACPDEPGGILLDPNTETPFSTINYSRTSMEPDKVYGEKIGSSYQGQIGARVSKHFEPFDFAIAARHFGKLNKEVLVHDARVLNAFRRIEDGFEPIRPDVTTRLVDEIQKRGFFHSRYDCEEDPLVLQVIPYTLLFGENDDIFAYVRASDIEKYGDERLFGKHSIGLGGHIRRSDGPNYVEGCMERETFDEEVEVLGSYSKPRLIGTIMAYDTPVDHVHFGLIYAGRVRGEVKAAEDSITSFGMMKFEDLPDEPGLYETWSRILIPHLPLINKAVLSVPD